MNSKCLYCGGQLKATIEQRYDNVPLYNDGYIPGEGDHVYSEVSNVRCSGCGRELSSDYYHSDECRLKSAVRAATAEDEKKQLTKPNFSLFLTKLKRCCLCRSL